MTKKCDKIISQSKKNEINKNVSSDLTKATKKSKQNKATKSLEDSVANTMFQEHNDNPIYPDCKWELIGFKSGIEYRGWCDFNRLNNQNYSCETVIDCSNINNYE